jgi:hypothetical protein
MHSKLQLSGDRLRRRADRHQATDSGSDEQSTLQYTWMFGNGTPSATGGPNVAHPYATLVDEYGQPVVGASADTGLAFVIGNK